MFEKRDRERVVRAYQIWTERESQKKKNDLREGWPKTRNPRQKYREDVW